MTSCDWAKDKATEFWSRLEFTHLKPNTKFTEPTLTEILVYDFWKSAEFLDFPFSIFHSTDEKSNGNDLEIAIETIEGDYILFPTQAKIIKRNHKDSRRTMLSNEVKTGLFIFDCVSESDRSRLPMAQQQLIKLYEAQGALSITSGVLDRNNRTVILNYTQI